MRGIMRVKRNNIGLILLALFFFLFSLANIAVNADTVYKNKYVRQSGNLYYYDKYGTLVKGFFTSKGGKLYYFDSETGAAREGIHAIDGKKYFTNYKGAVQFGYVTYDGNTYYADQSGIILTKWYTDGENKYYFGKDGIIHKGPWKVGSKTYVFDEKGKLLTNCFYEDEAENIYYAKSNGRIATGWFTIDGNKYYFDKTGVMQYGWLEYGSNTYYLDEKGIRQTGWLKLDGKIYCLNSKSGALRRNTFVNEKYIGMEGYWIKNPDEYFYPIMGESTVTVEQMVKAYKKHGFAYPTEELNKGGARTITTFCKMILQEANIEGVKAEVLFAQIMLETGWLQFGGDVSISQFNFGGIGATGGVPGNSFGSVRKGIRAQVQHLKAYASKNPLQKPCIDPRFTYVDRGKTPYVEWLGSQENPYKYGWAVNKGYGSKLMKIINEFFTTESEI